MVAAEEGYRVLAPGEPAAAPWTTFTGGKTVLAIAQHPQAATRLAFDVLPHLETDDRIDVVWSTPDLEYRWSGFDDFMRELKVVRVPWRQAQQTRYDLVISACFGGLAETIGPKVTTPHGINGARSRIGPFPDAPQHDLHPGQLVKNGEVVPSAILLPHEDDLATLAKSCPQALPVATVAGCPSFDRMLVSRPLRRRYRHALRVRPGQKLVVVTTTWSEYSLWNTDPTIFERLRAALPSWRYVIVAVVHPFVWLMHGRQKVLSLLSAARAAGVVVLPYVEGWRAALVAADLVIGDHGSVTQYGAALGIPILMNARSSPDIRTGSTADTLAQLVPPFDTDEPLLQQVRTAMGTSPPPEFADLAVSNRGQSARTLRRICYEQLGLTEPAHPVQVPVLPTPVPLA